MSDSNSKERSPAQIEASRANGAQSKGPKTPEGKAKSSRNRMAHGFRANCIPLTTESRAAYAEHLDAYMRRYAPADKVEEDLVGLTASNMWNVMRMSAIETALLDFEISGVDVHSIEETYENMDEPGRLALAFKKTAGDNALETLRRYKSFTERAFHRAFQAVEQIRKERTAPPPAEPPKTESTVRTQARGEESM